VSEPPFDPTLAYHSNYQPPTPPRRPASVTTLAIIGIILGGLAVLCTPFSLVFYFVKFGPPNPVIDATRNDPAWFGYTIVSLTIGWIMGLVLLVSSIGALMLKEWARKGMLAYAWIAIVMVPITLVVNFVWLNAKLTAATAGNPGAAIGQKIGGTIGPFVGLILPIFILIFMNKPHVKAAFASGDVPNM
jgi:hypothetical protein